MAALVTMRGLPKTRPKRVQTGPKRGQNTPILRPKGHLNPLTRARVVKRAYAYNHAKQRAEPISAPFSAPFSAPVAAILNNRPWIFPYRPKAVQKPLRNSAFRHLAGCCEILKTDKKTCFSTPVKKKGSHFETHFRAIFCTTF